MTPRAAADRRGDFLPLSSLTAGVVYGAACFYNADTQAQERFTPTVNLCRRNGWYDPYVWLPMTKICLDTNALQSNWMASGEAFTLLAELVAQGECQAGFSEISIQEHVRHYDKARDQIQSRLKSDLATYARLSKAGGKTAIVPEICDTATFEKRFRKRLQELGIVTLAIPDVPHAAMVARDLTETKPFNTTGKGYRDALIWLGFLAAIDDTTKAAVFVTSNAADFCEKGQAGLHPELVSEVAAKNPAAKVQWFASPQKLVDELVKPRLKEIEEDAKRTAKLLKRIQQDTFKGFTLESVVTEGIHDCEAAEAEGTFYGGDVPLEEPIYVTRVHDPEEIEAVALYKLSSGTYVCEGIANVAATVEGFLDKFEAFNQSESGAVFVSDPHWNEHYSEVEVTDIPVRLTFSFEFDAKSGEVEKFEVTKIESAG